MKRMQARSAFALTMMLLAPVGAAAQDAESGDESAPAADEAAAEAPAADEAAAEDEATDAAVADTPAENDAPDTAVDAPDDDPMDAASEPDAVDTAETPASPEDAPADVDADAVELEAVTEPGPDPVGNATPPEYKPPTRPVDPAVAGLSRANGTNRWGALESDGLRRELRLFIGSNNQFTTDASLDPFLFEEDRFTSGRFGVEAGLGNGLTLGATWTWGEDGRTIFDDVSTELEVRGGDVFARYSFEAVAVFLPYLQGEVGVRSVTARLRADDTSLSDDAMALAYGAFAGFELRYPFRNVSVALFNEHGYQGTTALTFDSARWNASDAEPLDLGDLSFSGYTWRMGLRLGVAF